MRPQIPTELDSQLGITSAHEEQVNTDYASSEPEITNASFESQQVFKLAKSDLNFLAALAAPTMFKFLFPSVFISCWNWLLTYVYKQRDFSKLALGLPRGFGKTTFIKFFIIYCILFTQKKYIVVISSNEKLAVNILTDVCTMLSNPNIRSVFGDWTLGITTDTQAAKTFAFRGRTINLQAIGKGGALRGTNKDNERPDIMIFEDIQTREEANSQSVSEDIETWMLGTAMKAKSPAGCLYIFVGNMYPTKYSILRKLKSNPSWTKFIVGGILQDGTSLWEELQPLTQLLEEYESDLNSGHPEIFHSEVLNDENASTNNAIDLSKMPEYHYDNYEVSAGDYIIVDPSNDKSNSDMVAIGHFQVIDGTPVARTIIEQRLSPGDIVREALSLCFSTGATLIVVEANAFQYSLLYWFGVISEQMGISGIEFVPIYSGSISKNSRILTMFKELLAGEVLIHPDAKTQIYHQITQFNPLKRDNTDGILDLLTYAQRVLVEYGQFISYNSVLGIQELGEARVQSMEENCEY
jgi:hypothetical protein